MKKLSTFTTIVILLLLPILNFAQSESSKKEIDDSWKEKKSTIKIGFPMIAYEHVLAHNRSVNFHILRWKSTYDDAPNPVVILSDVPLDEQAIISALTFTGEYRFYSGKKHAPSGFYVAPFLRHSRIKWTATDNNLDDGTNDNLPALGEFRLNGLGAGIQLGVQWNIKNTVTIDWGFFGLGVIRSKLKTTVRSDQQVDWEEAARLYTPDPNDIDNDFILRIAEKVKFEADGESMVSSIPLVLPTLRSTLTVGFRF